MEGRILKDEHDCQISMSDFIAQLHFKQAMRIHRQAMLKGMYCAKSGDSMRVHFRAMHNGMVSRNIRRQYTSPFPSDAQGMFSR
jgi:hypothetical protein